MEKIVIGPNSNTPLKLKPFDESLKRANLYPLTSSGITLFQVNMGRLCNQACRHCHVDAGPKRTEVMSGAVMSLILDILKKERHPVVDITGGAPEMNPGFMSFVESCVDIGCRVKTRTNLTILNEDGYEDLPEFFAENKAEVIASLPYFLPDSADRMRGSGVFDSSIKALLKLNSLGYGMEGTGLILDIVYNPCGAFLPPAQKAVEMDFRRELKKRHNISFTNLFTITNMPVGRFLKFLKDSGNLERYMERLYKAYNSTAAANVMCRNTLSIGWGGALYDCDFNQMLGLKCDHGAPDHLKDFDIKKLAARHIVTGPHCYGCTAGGGSSCSGATA